MLAATSSHPPESSCLDSAEALVQAGLHVVPLHSVESGLCTCGRSMCMRPGKHPLTLRGHFDAAADLVSVRQFWATWPHANLGLIVGNNWNASSTGLVVIDVDPRNGGLNSLLALESRFGALNSVVTVLTGRGPEVDTRGKHLYFRLPAGSAIRTRGRIPGWPGIEVKASGYVVAPPSLHVSGVAYEWENFAALTRVSDLTELPPWFVDLITDPLPPESATGGISREEGNGVMLAGHRNHTLFRLAAFHRACGADAGEIESVLSIVNEKRCHPPLESREVATIARSATRYEQESSYRGDAFAGSAREPSVAPLRVVSAADAETLVSPRPWLFEGLVREQTTLLLAGAAYVGKSTAVSEMSLRLAYGSGTFAGYPVAGARPRRVLVVSGEEVLDQVIARLRLQAGSTQLPAGLFVVDRGAALAGASLFSQRGLDQLRATIDDVEADVVVLDSLSSLVRADRNKAEVAEAVLAGLNGIGADRPLSFFCVSHVRKAGAQGDHGSTLDRLYGAQEWGSLSDVVLVLNTASGSERTGRVVLTIGKAKDCAVANPKIALVLDPETRTFQMIGSSDPRQNARKVHGVLPSVRAAFPQPVTCEELRRCFNCSDRTLQRNLAKDLEFQAALRSGQVKVHETTRRGRPISWVWVGVAQAA